MSITAKDGGNVINCHRNWENDRDQFHKICVTGDLVLWCVGKSLYLFNTETVIIIELIRIRNL